MRVAVALAVGLLACAPEPPPNPLPAATAAGGVSTTGRSTTQPLSAMPAVPPSVGPLSAGPIPAASVASASAVRTFVASASVASASVASTSASAAVVPSCNCGPGTDFSAVFEAVSPSVVGIVAGRQRNGRFQATQSGTGIVWDTRHIVTNDHLIADAEEVRVRTREGRVSRAEVVGNDGPTDLAVLRIGGGLTPPRRGRSAQLKPGQWVAAIGNPYGMDYSITVGVISAVGRQNLPPGGPKYGDFIQADLNLNPGNSGGPLVAANGEIVGMTTAIIGGAAGLSFASPIEMVETVVERLLRDGRFVRGFAGLFVKEVSWRFAKRAGLKRPQGARVRGVVKGGPAQEAGLQPGDIILRFGDRVVDDAAGLPWMIAATPPSSQIALAVARGSDRLSMTLALTEAK